jgi:hypothetical protein
MSSPFPFLRWLLRWEHHRLRRMIARLRRREGTLSFRAEQGGPDAGYAEVLAADLGCILTDHLDPAADALEKAARGVEPLREGESVGERETA